MAHPRVIISMLAMFATLAALAVPVAAQSQQTSIPITGHGFGHGRGLSQYLSLIHI